MERIIKALDKFAEIVDHKGYDGHFLTDAGHAEKLRNSISRYLHDSLLGKENGLTEPFFLTTYLEWNGEDRPSIKADLKTRFQNGKFEVSEMVLEYRDRYGKLMKEKELKDLSVEGLPEKNTALDLIKTPVKQKNTRRKRNKLG